MTDGPRKFTAIDLPALSAIDYDPRSKDIEDNSLLVRHEFLEALNVFSGFKEGLKAELFTELLSINVPLKYKCKMLDSWATSSIVHKPTMFLMRSENRPNELRVHEDRKRFYDWFVTLSEFLKGHNLESEWLVRHLARVLRTWLQDQKNCQKSLSDGFLQTYVKSSTFTFQFEIRQVNEDKESYIERTKRDFESYLSEFLDALDWLYQDQTPVRKTGAGLAREHMNWFLRFQVGKIPVKDILESVRGEANIDRSTVDKRIKGIARVLGIKRREEDRGRPKK